jgi:S1-C subfamily serine protease
MFVNAVARVVKAMFPIFAFTDVVPGQVKVDVLGTGFFINSHGDFASVAHLFDGHGPSTSFRYLGRLPEELVAPPLLITEVCRDDQRDVYVGHVDVHHGDFLVLRNDVVETGRSVAISGYPLAQLSLNAMGGVEVGGVRRYFQPTFVLDHVTGTATGPTGITRSHVGFLARDVGLFGMSGGPVFDVAGEVVGIQAAVSDRRVSKNADGREIAVENAIAIGSTVVIDVLANKAVRRT